MLKELTENKTANFFITESYLQCKNTAFNERQGKEYFICSNDKEIAARFKMNKSHKDTFDRKFNGEDFEYFEENKSKFEVALNNEFGKIYELKSRKYKK